MILYEYHKKGSVKFHGKPICTTTQKQKYDALKTAVKIAKAYARSTAEGYPTGVLKDACKAIVGMIDEIEQRNDSIRYHRPVLYEKQKMQRWTAFPLNQCRI